MNRKIISLISATIESLWDLDDNYNDAIYDHPYPNAVIGGYPVFT